MKVNCSNCSTELNLHLNAGAVTYRVPAAGRASKRVEAHTITTVLFYDGFLWTWDAPCCTDNGEEYADSYCTYQD